MVADRGEMIVERMDGMAALERRMIDGRKIDGVKKEASINNKISATDRRAHERIEPTRHNTVTLSLCGSLFLEVNKKRIS